MGKAENLIQRGIMDWLEILKNQGQLYFFRAGSGAVKTEQGRFFKTGRPGCPDIVACVAPSGRFVGLEVKTKTGRQSPAQKTAEAEIVEVGGVYAVVRSIGEAKQAITKVINND